jgi:predicted dehydrogenase
VNLTPEQQELGRRNFLKVVAGVPALAGLGTAAAMKGPLHGGPVKVGFIGLGGEGRVLLAQVDAAFAEVVAIADINPSQLQKADEVLQKTNKPPAHHYEEWRDMLQKENLEAVIIATPLWSHADIVVGCLDAG